MGNSASSQGSSTGSHDGDVGSSISEEQHDWPIEQAADTPEIQSLQEMRKPYNISATELPNFIRKYYLLHELLIFKYFSVSNIAFHTAVRHSKRLVREFPGKPWTLSLSGLTLELLVEED